jgi:hypothetical protein
MAKKPPEYEIVRRRGKYVVLMDGEEDVRVIPSLDRREVEKALDRVALAGRPPWLRPEVDGDT